MSAYKRISVEQADELLQTQLHLLLLDIRDMRDFVADHHPRALHLDNDALRSILKSRDKDTHIVVVCYHGNASKDIAQLFGDFGFRHCYSVDGGFEAWRNFLEMRHSVWSLATATS